MRRPIYMLFYDGGKDGRGNAEHLCKYIIKHYPDIKTGYILESDSIYWEKRKADGFNLIDALDITNVHKEMVKCSYFCSSVFNEGLNLDFSGCSCKRIFINNDNFLFPHKYIQEESKNIDLFIVDNKIAYNTLHDPYYQLENNQLVICGSPRHDALINRQNKEHEENAILIHFWQRPVVYAKENNAKFLESNLYKKTCELLSNTKLIETCKKHNLIIIFKMHNVQYNWLEYFKKFKSKIIKISPVTESLETVYVKSKMVITDVNEYAYDMAKIGKPCLYFLSDTNPLSAWRRKKNGCFDFDTEQNCLGPIIRGSIPDLVNNICSMIKNNYKLDKKYADRVEKLVSFKNDNNNCQRCLNAIFSIDKSRTEEKTIDEIIKCRNQKYNGELEYNMKRKLKFIIIDRLTRARDNGEYFYRYLKDNHPEIEILFGLHHESPDWERLTNEGFNLVDLANKEEIIEKCSDCSHFLFSESNLGYTAVNEVIDRTKIIYIYLNHGCFFARGNRCYPVGKFDYMICGNRKEYESVIYNAEQEGLTTKKYLLTGLPRMDEQVKKYNESKNKNIVMIQPWWRNNLTGWRVVENINQIDPKALIKLKESDFVKGYNALLNNPEFKKLCEENNLRVIFKRHPVMENIPGVFDVPKWIIDEPQESFTDIFAETKVYITDYSSNAFETANLGIPCIYFEPDYKNLTIGCNRPEWAWNVNTEGLGPVAFSSSTFVDLFKKLIKNDYKLDDIYLRRRNSQIAFFRDNNNCKRCLEAILTNNVKVTENNVRWDRQNQGVTQRADGKSNCYLYF